MFHRLFLLLITGSVWCGCWCDPSFPTEKISTTGSIEISNGITEFRHPVFTFSQPVFAFRLYDNQDRLVTVVKSLEKQNTLISSYDCHPCHKDQVPYGKESIIGCMWPETDPRFSCVNFMDRRSDNESLGQYTAEVELANGERSSLTYLVKGECLGEFRHPGDAGPWFIQCPFDAGDDAGTSTDDAECSFP